MNYNSFGKGKNIVFLHGWGGDTSAFLFFANILSSKFRVTLVDFSGFGKSPEPDSAYTIKDYCNELFDLIDLLKIEKAVFVGHSFGGRVALELSAFYPDRVAGLVLCDSAGIKPKRRIKYYIKIYLHKFLKKLGFRGLKGSSDYKQLSNVMKQTFVNVVNYDQTYLLEKISQPTAIFWGKNDNETPLYMAKILHKGIDDSFLHILNGGHFAYIEDRDNFYLVLSAFLDELVKGECYER